MFNILLAALLWCLTGTISQCLANSPKRGPILFHNAIADHVSNMSFAINIPHPTEESPNLVFLRLEGPVDGTQWFALMHGTQLSGSNMIVVYTSSGDGLTVSPRTAFDNHTFSFDTDKSVRLLAGTGIDGGRMVANIRCEGCMAWSDHNGSISASDQKSFWTWAHRRGPPLNVWDPGYDLLEPSQKGTFTWNLSDATGGDIINPFHRTVTSDANGNHYLVPWCGCTFMVVMALLPTLI